ncbi:hypothetical protein Xen7305DRAFT_00017440 [Xenococcus sp. PCC 7305]|uniref:hypothetical protein n=1 Tax=Xenococcus sp. PCC 7305 TaxID=102125 RepID=UPI0002AC8803|nr:hypothetical protein [Xenococcus sp. PCC 7305]ELS02034.1 hypothetical protein Xen7305DRAFT_00017440 [Xenococcus sp. PCC 7305]
MDPELIAQVLDEACQYDSLNFQIMVQESVLHIYINRELDIELDYDLLVNNITDALITINVSWEGFWLYSRVMGEIDPDWQTYIELQADVSNNPGDPWIEKTEDLIKEAKESLKDLKYLQDKDISELEELDDAILNKNSFLLVMESAEEVENSTGEIEEELEDLFVVEELDESILDKNSHLLAKESAEEVENSTGEVEEELEDLFAVEELDESILDKNSHLLAKESVEEVENSTGEIEEELEDLFAVEELDESILDINSHLLAKESVEEVENSTGELADQGLSQPEELDDAILNEKTFLLIDNLEDGIEEQQTEDFEDLFVVEDVDNSTGEVEEELEDLFAVEESDDSILDENSHLLAKESVEEVDNSSEEFANKDLSQPEELDDAILNEETFLLIDDLEDGIEEQQTEDFQDLFVIEELAHSTEEIEEEPEDLPDVEDFNHETPGEEPESSVIESDNTKDNNNNNYKIEEEDIFVAEGLDDEIPNSESDNLSVDSNQTEDYDDNHEIEEEDIFAVEELGDEIPNSESDDLPVALNENTDQSENSLGETINFSEYCFVRNQGLLESDLVAPKLNIAYILRFFHDLSQEHKILLLPLLNQHFKLQEVVSEAQKEQLLPETQDWLQKIADLNAEQTRKAAIWFSRYCLNPEKTIAEIQKIFDAETLKQELENQNSDQQTDSTDPENKKNRDHSQLINSPSSSSGKSHLPQKDQVIEQEVDQKKFSDYNLNLIVPAICVVVTLLFVILGIFLINSNSVDQEEKQSVHPGLSRI